MYAPAMNGSATFSLLVLLSSSMSILTEVVFDSVFKNLLDVFFAVAAQYYDSLTKCLPVVACSAASTA